MNKCKASTTNKQLKKILKSGDMRQIHFGLQNSQCDGAYLFALVKHEGQYRLNGEPYIVHPLHVLTNAMQFSCDKDIMQASLLHDVVEDTNTSVKEIEYLFGEKTASLVSELTLPKTVKHAEKGDFLAGKVLILSDEALLIKLCDRLDNVKTLFSLPEAHADRVKNDTYKILHSLEENRHLDNSQKAIVDQIYDEISRNK